jgi:hypothetical protein
MIKPFTQEDVMTNFDLNIDNIIESHLNVKASGAILDQVAIDLNLPDGENIDILLANEKNAPKNPQ